ncbi:MAG: heme-dependent oxidative N-demethylase subunit alpha family protein [Pseudomonadales bacterium]
MTRTFWADPPWRGGRGPFRLGLTPIAESDWLPEPVDNSERLRKQDLLRNRRADVLARMDADGGAVDAVVTFVRDRLKARGWPEMAGDEDPLAAIALAVPEDLCVMMASARGWVLAGACLCSPSFWRLADKIGHPLDVIHAPVQGLDAVLGERMTRFLDRLPLDRVFERVNWNVHLSRERFQPRPERWPNVLEPADCDGLHIRSERQTLRRVDAERILFSIDVRQFPLAELADHPRARDDLEAAIRNMTPPERSAFGYARHGAALLEWLGQLRAMST